MSEEEFCRKVLKAIDKSWSSCPNVQIGYVISVMIEILAEKYVWLDKPIHKWILANISINDGISKEMLIRKWESKVPDIDFTNADDDDSIILLDDYIDEVYGAYYAKQKAARKEMSEAIKEMMDLSIIKENEDGNLVSTAGYL